MGPQRTYEGWAAAFPYIRFCNRRSSLLRALTTVGDIDTGVPDKPPKDGAKMLWNLALEVSEE